MRALASRYKGLLLAGVDEVGRGPLAGDVIAAAVILDPKAPVPGLADSKKLSERRRKKLAAEIKKNALCWSIARSTIEEIDLFNILTATMIAMERAVSGLKTVPEHVVVDGNRLPSWSYSSESIIKGDVNVPSISAASIIAKVYRDEEMFVLNQTYPGYGFDAHKGYGTKKHMEAIKKLGPSPIHRKSFEPIKSMFF
ncbi:MAG: ribonuclease HII [Saprospiraceae bacterium]|jgi:ribonuclease HII